MKTPQVIDTAMLIPREISTINKDENLLGADDEGWKTIEEQKMWKAFHAVKHMVRSISKRLHLHLHLEEYPMYYRPQDNFVLGFQRAESMSRSDLTIALNPNAKELAYSVGIARNPVRRMIAAFTDFDLLDEQLDAMRALRFPIGTPEDGEEIDTLPRVFPMHIPANDKQAAKYLPANCSVVENALLYPHIPMRRINRRQLFSSLQ